MDKKEEKLRDIQELLKLYGGEVEIDSYILEYLTLEDLDSIELNILKKQSSVIEDNSQWLEQFKSQRG